MTRSRENNRNYITLPARISRLIEVCSFGVRFFCGILMLTVVIALFAAHGGEAAGFVAFLSIVILGVAIAALFDRLREPASTASPPPLRIARLRMPPRSARLRRLNRMVAKTVACRWNCPNCAAALSRGNEVSPSGDVKCLHCDSWYNVNCQVWGV